MAYRQLSTESIAEYLQGIPEMKKVFSSFNELDIREIGDGNLNYVYLVKNKEKPNESVALKQAVPFLRIVGESWPLPKERMTIEIKALLKASEWCPQNVPEIFFYSHEMSLVVMKDLSSHGVLRGQMIEGMYFPKLADHISTYLAQNLFHTSDLFLDHREKKEMVREFINIDLCKITEDFVFTHPYEQNETNVYNPELKESDIKSIQEDSNLKISVAEMKKKFMTEAQALIHGDLHTGSIMASEEETFVIDPEFAFVGPMGFDLGAIIGNLLMSYFSHEYRQPLLGKEPYQYRKWLLETIESLWSEFVNKFEHLWINHQNSSGDLYWDYDLGVEHFKNQREKYILDLLQDSIGFAACKMMRRILGLAKVADIADITDLKERARIENITLQVGKKMVTERKKFRSISEVIDLAQEFSTLK